MSTRKKDESRGKRTSPKIHHYSNEELLERIDRLQKEGHDETMMHLAHLIEVARKRGLSIPNAPYRERPRRSPVYNSPIRERENNDFFFRRF